MDFESLRNPLKSKLESHKSSEILPALIFSIKYMQGRERICIAGSFCKALKYTTHHPLTGPDVSSQNGSQETH